MIVGSHQNASTKDESQNFCEIFKINSKTQVNKCESNFQKYNYMETIAGTFIIPSRQNQFIQESKFNNAPIRRVAVAMKTNSAVAESYFKNLFSYQLFHLRELRTTRAGRAIVSLDTTSPCRPYVTTMKAR